MRKFLRKFAMEIVLNTMMVAVILAGCLFEFYVYPIDYTHHVTLQIGEDLLLLIPAILVAALSLEFTHHRKDIKAGVTPVSNNDPGLLTRNALRIIPLTVIPTISMMVLIICVFAYIGFEWRIVIEIFSFYIALVLSVRLLR